MEGLLPFLVIAFVFYRIFRAVKPEHWRKLIEEAQRQQQSHSKQNDLQEILRQTLGAPDQRTAVPNRAVSADKDYKLFSEDTWRRQLFIGSLLIGLGYLVYLVVT